MAAWRYEISLLVLKNISLFFNPGREISYICAAILTYKSSDFSRQLTILNRDMVSVFLILDVTFRLSNLPISESLKVWLYHFLLALPKHKNYVQTLKKYYQ